MVVTSFALLAERPYNYSNVCVSAYHYTWEHIMPLSEGWMDTFTQVSSVQFNTAAMMKDNFSIEKKYTFSCCREESYFWRHCVPVQKNGTTYSQCFNKGSTFSITPKARTLETCQCLIRNTPVNILTSVVQLSTLYPLPLVGRSHSASCICMCDSSGHIRILYTTWNYRYRMAGNLVF